MAHHGLIKLLVEDSLRTYKIPLSWEAFRNLTKDSDIKMLTEEHNSSRSEEKKSAQKDKGQEPTAKEPTKDQKWKQKEKATEEKGEKSTLTPREQRLQSRAGKTEPIHMGTSKAASPKPKSQTPSDKPAKSVPKPVSTGKPKPVSTGKQKATSTGSPKEKKPKEKKAESLEREAAAVLAALSTPPKPREKRKREAPLYFKARRSVRIKRASHNRPPAIRLQLRTSLPHLGRSPPQRYRLHMKGEARRPPRGKKEWTAWLQQRLYRMLRPFYRKPWHGSRRPKRWRERHPRHHQGKMW